MSDFYRYFKENMEGLGLPAPENLFGTVQAAVANAAVILTQVDKFGKTLTIGELIGAGTKLEQLGAISACSAAFYVGAVVGSIAVATGRTLADGTSLSDVIYTATRYQLNRPWLTPNLHRWPGIYDAAVPARRMYRYQAAHP
jgi:hypothetical protein